MLMPPLTKFDRFISDRKVNEVPRPPSIAGICGKSSAAVSSDSVSSPMIPVETAPTGADLVESDPAFVFCVDVFCGVFCPNASGCNPITTSTTIEQPGIPMRIFYGTTTVSPDCRRMFCSGFLPLITSL